MAKRGNETIRVRLYLAARGSSASIVDVTGGAVSKAQKSKLVSYFNGVPGFRLGATVLRGTLLSARSPD